MLRCKRCGFNLWGGNQGGWKWDVKFEMSARGPHGSQEKEGWEHQHTERESNRARVKTARLPGKSMCGRARANRVLRSGEGLEGRCTGQWGLGSKMTQRLEHLLLWPRMQVQFPAATLGNSQLPGALAPERKPTHNSRGKGWASRLI